MNSPLKRVVLLYNHHHPDTGEFKKALEKDHTGRVLALELVGNSFVRLVLKTTATAAKTKSVEFLIPVTNFADICPE